MSSGIRYAVLGSSGQLGSALLARLREARASVAAPSRAELDLASAEAVASFLAAADPEVVINAAAFTDVAGAERPESRGVAFALNAELPGALAAWAARRGARLVHVSTDYVFDGSAARPYREDDPPAPLQVYGLSKLEGERRVLEADPNAIVARTSTLFGTGKRARPNYVDAILAQARAGGRLHVVELPVASPTLAADLADGLLRLLAARAHGIVHVTNAGWCSRLELATAAVRAAGLAGVEVRVREPAEDPLRRPAFSALDGARFTALAGGALRSWREALAEYVRTTAP